jgi:hypothetical protein
MPMRSVRSLFAFLAVTFAACGGTPVTSPQTPPRGEAPANGSPAAAKAIVDAADRSAADKALDGGRHPAETLAFFDVRPGMKVAELGAGGGYTAELLARAVGSSGTVYGQNSKFILEKFAEKPWTERLTKPVMKNVVRVDREFDDPLPPEAKDLDVVFVVLFLPRHGLARGRPREDEPRDSSRAQAWRHLRRDRPFRSFRHGHQRDEDAPPDRGKRRSCRDREGRLQVHRKSVLHGERRR